MPEFSSRPPPEKQACKGQSDGRPCDEIVKGREPGVEDISGVNLVHEGIEILSGRILISNGGPGHPGIWTEQESSGGPDAKAFVVADSDSLETDPLL